MAHCFCHEGFRIVGACTVQKLNRRWAQVQVPKVDWVRFRLTRRSLSLSRKMARAGADLDELGDVDVAPYRRRGSTVWNAS